MARQDHYIGVDAIEKRLKKAKSELIKLQQELNSLNEQKQSFGELSDAYEKYSAGDKFELMEEYSESGKNAAVIGDEIKKADVRIEELKRNPVLLAMIDRV